MSEIKDSGERTEFSTGAVRDMHEGKGRCDLLPMCALLRLSRHFENGSKKYGERNWEKGVPGSSFYDSSLRHLLKYGDGWDDEDHLIAAAWNLLCLAWTEAKHPELIDIPARKGKKTFNYGESAEMPASISYSLGEKITDSVAINPEDAPEKNWYEALEDWVAQKNIAPSQESYEFWLGDSKAAGPENNPHSLSAIIEVGESHRNGLISDGALRALAAVHEAAAEQKKTPAVKGVKTFTEEEFDRWNKAQEEFDAKIKEQMADDDKSYQEGGPGGK